MGRSTFILLVLLNQCFIISCSDRDDEILNACLEISQNPNWSTENFKVEYLIQFPKNYEGTGMTGFEGNIFNKTRVDKKVELTYSFCTATYCYDFGNALDEPIPNSLNTKGKDGNDAVLNLKREFCSKGEIIGYFYFNEETNATGKYYMKRDSVYLEALRIYFSNTEILEVESIISTIAEK